MKIGYTIISINDDRRRNKDAIRASVRFDESTDIQFVNGREHGTLERYFRDNPTIRLEGYNRTRGELGVWFSMINCWRWLVKQDKYDALVIFEDDARVQEDFTELVTEWLNYVPEDVDALSIFVPDNQLQDFNYQVMFDEIGNPIQTNSVKHNVYILEGNNVICRSYQGYSCVCMMWTRQGAQKMLDLVEQKGMYVLVDCQIFLEANLRNLNVYAPWPDEVMPVWYDWNNSPTLVHDTYPYEGSSLP